MKNPLYIVCASSLSLFCAPDSFAENTDHKSGFYVTGKVGASVLQQKNQKYLGRYQYYMSNTNTDSYDLYNYSYDGKANGTHSNARLGGGIAVGYNFDNYFHVPVRTEIDVMARMRDSSNYLSGRQTYNYSWMAKTTDEQHVNNKVQLNTFMFNAFYDFKNKSAFTPYIMAGVGLGSFKHTSILNNSETIYDTSDEPINYSESKSRKSRTANNFAWNAGAGVRYKINEDFDLDFSYRYLDAGKSSMTTWSGSTAYYYIGGYEKSKTKVVSQDMMLGLTYNI